MKEHRFKKSYKSLLTRWVDQLLASNFETEHLPGIKIGQIDHISCKPNQVAPNITHFDDQFVVAKLDQVKRSAKRFLLYESNNGSIAPQIEAIYQPMSTNDKTASKNDNFSACTEGLNTIDTNLQFGAKRHSSKGMNKLIDKNEPNHTTNLTAQTQLDSPQSNFEDFCKTL